MHWREPGNILTFAFVINHPADPCIETRIVGSFALVQVDRQIEFVVISVDIVRELAVNAQLIGMHVAYMWAVQRLTVWHWPSDCVFDIWQRNGDSMPNTFALSGSPRGSAPASCCAAL